jgi:predicted DNA-binding protein with PD1-like motif
MKSKLLSDREGEKTYALIFDIGDEVMSTLLAFARANQLAGSRFEAIGAFQDVTLAYFVWEKKQYAPIPIREQVEVISLLGDIALGPDGQPALHAHVVVGKSDGTAHGGHLVQAHVRPTLEVIITESPTHLQRKIDPATGLATIQF